MALRVFCCILSPQRPDCCVDVNEHLATSGTLGEMPSRFMCSSQAFECFPHECSGRLFARSCYHFTHSMMRTIWPYTPVPWDTTHSSKRSNNRRSADRCQQADCQS